MTRNSGTVTLDLEITTTVEIQIGNRKGRGATMEKEDLQDGNTAEFLPAMVVYQA